MGGGDQEKYKSQRKSRILTGSGEKDGPSPWRALKARLCGWGHIPQIGHWSWTGWRAPSRGSILPGRKVSFQKDKKCGVCHRPQRTGSFSHSFTREPSPNTLPSTRDSNMIEPARTLGHRGEGRHPASSLWLQRDRCWTRSLCLAGGFPEKVTQKQRQAVCLHGRRGIFLKLAY